VLGFRQRGRGGRQRYRPLPGVAPVYVLATGRVLAVTPEFDLVSGLLAVLAAVFPERSVWLDDALTNRVRTLRC
jgi:hypothetical protein